MLDCRHYRTVVIMFILMIIANMAFASGVKHSLWEVGFSSKNGLSLTYQGVPIIRQSTLYVVTPGWKSELYNQKKVKQTITRSNKSGSVDWTVTASNQMFSAKYHIKSIGAHQFSIIFTGTLKKDIPARIEYCLGYFNANLISHRSYRAEVPSGTARGVAPAWPISSNPATNKLALNFTKIIFNSRIGKLGLSVNQPVTFFDARRDRHRWAWKAPVFWCGLGVPTRPLTYGKPTKLKALITIYPQVDLKEHSQTFIKGTPNLTAVPDAMKTGGILIIPKPKHLIIKKGHFTFSSPMPWSIQTPTKKAPRLVNEIRDVLKNRFGIQLKGLVSKKNVHQTTIRIGDLKNLAVPDFKPDMDWKKNPEGYFLQINKDGAIIVSSTPQGAFYGLQTLSQLIRKMHNQVIAMYATVRDWPSLHFRGAHWFPIGPGVPFDRKLIKRIMARLKMNRVVLQVDTTTRWDSQPEIAPNYAISKKNLRQLVKLSRENFIQPIPLVNTLGHVGWLFRNGQNSDLKASPESKWNYNPNNPRTYKVIHNIFKEVIEIFHPKIMNIGHDEVSQRNNFPYDGQSLTQVLINDIKKLHGWLKNRNIQTMIWSDMFLSRSKLTSEINGLNAPSPKIAIQRRDLLPKGITIADWHYMGHHRDYPSIKLFQNQGFKVIGSTWYRPNNIYYFSHALARDNAEGLLQTTWGKARIAQQSNLKRNLKQFSAFVLAADYAWSMRVKPPSSLPYNANKIFKSLYSNKPIFATQKKDEGFLVNLNHYARVNKRTILGFGKGWGLEKLPAGQLRADDILFAVPQNVIVVGNFVVPRKAVSKIQITCNRKSTAVAILQSALWRTPVGTIASKMQIIYQDGSKVTQPIIVGKQTAALLNGIKPSDPPLGWLTNSPSGGILGLHVWKWKNPHPDKVIKNIAFTSGSPEQGLVIAGITLLK